MHRCKATTLAFNEDYNSRRTAARGHDTGAALSSSGSWMCSTWPPNGSGSSVARPETWMKCGTRPCISQVQVPLVVWSQPCSMQRSARRRGSRLRSWGPGCTCRRLAATRGSSHCLGQACPAHKSDPSHRLQCRDRSQGWCRSATARPRPEWCELDHLAGPSASERGAVRAREPAGQQ